MDTQGDDRNQGIPPAAQPGEVRVPPANVGAAPQGSYQAQGQPQPAQPRVAAQPYPPAPVKKRSGGKIAAIIIAVVAALLLLSCCGFSIYALSLPTAGGSVATFGDTIPFPTV